MRARQVDSNYACSPRSPFNLVRQQIVPRDGPGTVLGSDLGGDTTPLPESPSSLRGSLLLLRQPRRLVGAAAVDGGNGNVEHTQVDGQLAAMVVPVIEQHGAEHLDAGNGEDLASSGRHPPGSERLVVFQGGEEVSRLRNTGVQFRHEVDPRIRLRGTRG